MKSILKWIILFVLNTTLAQTEKIFTAYETLNDVDTIEIHDNLCVIFYPTYFNGIQVKGNKNVMEIIKWDFENSVLNLYTTEENTLAYHAEIIIYLKGLKELRLSGNASAQTDEKIVTDSLTLYTTDNSTFNFPIECKDFTLFSEGSSSGYLQIGCQNLNIHSKGAATASIVVEADHVNVEQKDESFLQIKGKTRSLSTLLYDKAKISAWTLKADDVYLFSSNTEETKIYVEHRLKLNAQGKGEIYIYGRPRQIDTIAYSKKAKIFYKD